MAVSDTVHEIKTRVFAAGYEANDFMLYPREFAHFQVGLYSLIDRCIPRISFAKVNPGNVDRSRGCYVSVRNVSQIIELITS